MSGFSKEYFETPLTMRALLLSVRQRYSAPEVGDFAVKGEHNLTQTLHLQGVKVNRIFIDDTSKTNILRYVSASCFLSPCCISINIHVAECLIDNYSSYTYTLLRPMCNSFQKVTLLYAKQDNKARMYWCTARLASVAAPPSAQLSSWKS